jgi:hypothetical protein
MLAFRKTKPEEAQFLNDKGDGDVGDSNEDEGEDDRSDFDSDYGSDDDNMGDAESPTLYVTR